MNRAQQSSFVGRHGAMLTGCLRVVMICAALIFSAPARASCPGDLNGDGIVLVDEILTMVHEALNGCPVGVVPCPGDLTGRGSISVTDILAAVNALLTGCPRDPSPTQTALPPTVMPSPTATPSPAPSETPTATPTATVGDCPFTFDDDTLSQSVLCDYLGSFSNDPDCPNDLEASFTSDGSVVGVAIGTSPDVVMFVGNKVSSTEADLTGYTVGQGTAPIPVSGKIKLQNGGHELVIAPDSSPFDLGFGQQVCSFDQYDGTFVGVLGGQGTRPMQRSTPAWLVAEVAAHAAGGRL